MNLPTYPRLNLPTKRLGIESGDWIWVSGSMFPGLAFKSFTLFLGCLFVAYFYAAKIKPKRPRGWLTGWIEYRLTPHKFMAYLERRMDS